MHDHKGGNLTVAIENVIDNMPRRNEESVSADIEAGSNQTPPASRIVGQQRKCVPDGIWTRAVRRREMPRLWIRLTAEISQGVWHTDGPRP